MATPYFEPIVSGGGFDGVAAQRQFWGNRNLATREANIAREIAAQQNLNDYFSRDAVMRENAEQRNVALQLQQDNEARKYAWYDEQSANAQREAEAQRKWLAGQNREAVKLEEAKLGLKREQIGADIDANGQAIAAQYPAVKRAYEETSSSVANLENELSRLEDRQKELDTKAGTRAPLGIWGGLTTEEKNEQAANLMRQGAIKKLLNPKGELYRERDRAERMLEKFQDQLTGTGYSIDEDAGVVRHNTGKAWNFRQAVQAAARGADIIGPLAVAPNVTLAMADAMSRAWPASSVSPPSPGPVATGGKQLTRADAQAILTEAGGNKDRARQLARERGYVWR